jgi:hypothetical protein
MSEFFTIGQLAEQLQEPEWRVRRVVDSLAPGLPRAGLYRVIPADLAERVAQRVQQRREQQEAPA